MEICITKHSIPLMRLKPAMDFIFSAELKGGVCVNEKAEANSSVDSMWFR